MPRGYNFRIIIARPKLNKCNVLICSIKKASVFVRRFFVKNEDILLL